MKKKKIEDLSDKKILETMYDCLQRAVIKHQLISNDDGVITHELTVVTCGDKFFMSEPRQLEHPLIVAAATGVTH